MTHGIKPTMSSMQYFLPTLTATLLTKESKIVHGYGALLMFILITASMLEWRHSFILRYVARNLVQNCFGSHLVEPWATRSQVHCLTCTPPEKGHGVVSSCLNCFLTGGILYRLEYGVSPAYFIAKARGGIFSATKEFPQALPLILGSREFNHQTPPIQAIRQPSQASSRYFRIRVLILMAPVTSFRSFIVFYET